VKLWNLTPISLDASKNEKTWDPVQIGGNKFCRSAKIFCLAYTYIMLNCQFTPIRFCHYEFAIITVIMGVLFTTKKVWVQPGRGLEKYSLPMGGPPRSSL